MEIIAYCFFDIILNFLEKNMYANLLTRCDDACIITPYLFIYLFIKQIPKLTINDNNLYANVDQKISKNLSLSFLKKKQQFKYASGCMFKLLFFS